MRTLRNLAIIIAGAQATAFLFAPDVPRHRIVAIAMGAVAVGGLAGMRFGNWSRKLPWFATAVVVLNLSIHAATTEPGLSARTAQVLLLLYMMLGLAAFPLLTRRTGLINALLIAFSACLGLFTATATLARAPLPSRPNPEVRSRKGLVPHPVIGFYHLARSTARTLYEENPSGYYDRLSVMRWRWHLGVFDLFGVASLRFPPQDGGVMSVRIDRLSKPEPWRVQLEQSPVHIVAGQTYRLSFGVRAAAARTFIVAVRERQPPWNHRGLQNEVHADTTWLRFDTTFVAAASDTNARLYFELGREAVSVDLANVQLSHVSTGEIVQAPAPIEFAITYRLNDMGCRGPDQALRRAPNTWRILTIGDSYTLGEGVKESDTFSSVLQQRLTDSSIMSSPGRRSEVINCGVAKYGVRQIRQLYDIIGSRYAPDLVVLTLGTDRDDDPDDVLREIARLATTTRQRAARLVVVAHRDTTEAAWNALLSSLKVAMATEGVPLLSLGDANRPSLPSPAGDGEVSAPRSHRDTHRDTAVRIAQFLRDHCLLGFQVAPYARDSAGVSVTGARRCP